MSEFKKYNRKQKPSEMRPHVVGEDLTGISISDEDALKGYPDQEGNMIARNPEKPNDQWFINRDYFHKNFYTDPID